MTIQDVLGLTITTYSSLGYDFKETTFVLKVHPFLVTQLLAFDGDARLADGGHLHVSDWGQLPKDVLSDLKNTLYLSFAVILSGKKQPNEEGFYELTSIGTSAKMQAGGIISLPDHELVLKNRRNVKTRRII